LGPDPVLVEPLPGAGAFSPEPVVLVEELEGELEAVPDEEDVDGDAPPAAPPLDALPPRAASLPPADDATRAVRALSAGSGAAGPSLDIAGPAGIA
jgi:hypothetical protein